jgi:hypothetical protein
MKEKKYVVPANEYSKTDQAWCALKQAKIAGEAMWEEHAQDAVDTILEPLDDDALDELSYHGDMILGIALVQGMFEEKDDPGSKERLEIRAELVREFAPVVKMLSAGRLLRNVIEIEPAILDVTKFEGISTRDTEVFVDDDDHDAIMIQCRWHGMGAKKEREPATDDLQVFRDMAGAGWREIN